MLKTRTIAWCVRPAAPTIRVLHCRRAPASQPIKCDNAQDLGFNHIGPGFLSVCIQCFIRS